MKDWSPYDFGLAVFYVTNAFYSARFSWMLLLSFMGGERYPHKLEVTVTHKQADDD